jgi:hypothetical protein
VSFVVSARPPVPRTLGSCASTVICRVKPCEGGAVSRIRAPRRNWDFGSYTCFLIANRQKKPCALSAQSETSGFHGLPPAPFIIQF